MTVGSTREGSPFKDKIMTLRKWTRPANPAMLEPWMDLEELAEVEVSSEDSQFPIDGALIEGDGRGWRAAEPGEQKLRIRFDAPQSLGVIHLVFEEAEYERVQEFTLQWSPDRGRTFHALVRQQFTFSPAGAVRETENYAVALKDVTDLELHIVPDVSRRPLVATLSELRLR